jgi:hypothetical protein
MVGERSSGGVTRLGDRFVGRESAALGCRRRCVANEQQLRHVLATRVLSGW